MAEVFQIHPEHLDQATAALDAAGEVLAEGGLVVMPTETVYGLACRADLTMATAAMFEAKRRPAGLSLPLLARTAAEAFDAAVPDPVARALAAAFWPGPLTLVLSRTDRSRPWSLGDATGTVGVRVPDHAVPQGLLDRSRPLAATSANVSGFPPLVTAEELVETFGARAGAILVLAAGVPPPAGRPSTVVDLTGPRPAVLRRGAISGDRLAAVAGTSAGAQWVDFTP